MSSSTQTKLPDMTTLSEGEEEALKSIEETFDNPNSTAEEKQKILKWVSTYPVRLLYAFSKKSQKINDLFETNPYLNERWSLILKQLGYTCNNITSFDKTKKVSLFTQLKAVALLRELNKHPDLNSYNSFVLLNEASQLGLFDALMMRLKYYDKKLFEMDFNKADVDAIDRQLDMVLHDANMLSNLYWSVGSLDAGITLLNVTDYFLSSKKYKEMTEQFLGTSNPNQFSWLTKYNDKHAPYPILILETAVESIYKGFLIANTPQSKKITDQVAPGNDLLYVFGEGVRTPAEVQQYIVDNLKAMDIPQIDSFCAIAFERALKKVSQHYHDIELPKNLEEFTQAPAFNFQ